MKRRGFVALVPLFAAACSHSNTDAINSPSAPAVRATVHKKAEKPGPDSLASQQIALVPAGTFGPYVGSRAEGAVAAWAPLIDGKRRWVTVPVAVSEPKPADAKTVADAGTDVDLVALRPLGGATLGFLLLASSREFSGERVDALALGLHGELAGGPTPLAQSLGDVVWVDAVPTRSGAIAMWAVRHDDRADLFGVEIGPSGDLRDTPALIAEGARAWQTTKISGGAAVVVLSAGKARGDKGPLRVAFVDTEGHLERKSLVVNDGTTVGADVDLTAVGDRLLLAWSDRKDAEPRVYGAVIDAATGSLVKPPAPLLAPYGAQAVVRLVPPVPPSGPAFLAWEDLVERRESGRVIRLAQISADGVLGQPVGMLDVASADAVPELAATPNGVGAITLAPACKRGTSSARARVVPTFVQFDAAFNLLASEPIRLESLQGESVDLAWGLGCQTDGCTALAAGSSNPAPAFSVKLGAVSMDWEPAGGRANDAPKPRATEMSAVATPDSVAELSATRVGAASTLAWVTDFDPATPFVRSKTPAPDGKYEAPRALVAVLTLPDKGVAAAPTVLSYRAHSPGGVAVVPSDTPGGVAVAWVGIDEKIPQVFLTQVLPDGKKGVQKMLTHSKGGVSDVALAKTSDGYVVAFIDESVGASEVHVTKVDRAGKPLVPEKRIGAAASTAADVQLLVEGDRIFAVWAEARGPSAGVADIFAARLAAQDLSLVGTEHVIFATPTHSHSPAIASIGQGAAVVWVEDSGTGDQSAPGALTIARLDSGGEPVAGSMATVTLDGTPEGVGITCTIDACHVSASITTTYGGALEAFVWKDVGQIRPTRVVNLRARPRDGVAPVVLGNDVFYDEGDAGDARVRRLGVDWE